MPRQKQGVFDPDDGGVRIPELVQRQTAERLVDYDYSQLCAYFVTNPRQWRLDHDNPNRVEA